MRRRARRRTSCRVAVLGIQMNKHGSSARVEGGIEKGRTWRRAKMNYGGTRRKMLRDFPTAWRRRPRSARRLPSSWLCNDRRAISREKGTTNSHGERTIARSTATSVLRVTLNLIDAYRHVKREEERERGRSFTTENLQGKSRKDPEVPGND